jgi:hypothetical protein
MRTFTLSLLAGVGLTAAAAGFRPAPAHPAPAAGSIVGTVTFTGTPPKMKPIDMAKEPSCAAQHKEPVMTENAVTGPGNTLEWVVVYISEGDQLVSPPGTPVKFTQEGCQYLPHVLAMQAGQQLEIINADKTSHNIHPLPRLNPEWNKSQPPGAPPIETSYNKSEFIAVKCNIHPWMHGYFAVLPTGNYAVTGGDGKFAITGLPPGKYTLTAWHEKFGTLSQQVTVGAGAATANFVFKATPW